MAMISWANPRRINIINDIPHHLHDTAIVYLVQACYLSGYRGYIEDLAHFRGIMRLVSRMHEISRRRMVMDDIIFKLLHNLGYSDGIDVFTNTP